MWYFYFCISIEKKTEKKGCQNVGRIKKTGV